MLGLNVVSYIVDKLGSDRFRRPVEYEMVEMMKNNHSCIINSIRMRIEQLKQFAPLQT